MSRAVSESGPIDELGANQRLRSTGARADTVHERGRHDAATISAS